MVSGLRRTLGFAVLVLAIFAGQAQAARGVVALQEAVGSSVAAALRIHVAANKSRKRVQKLGRRWIAIRHPLGQTEVIERIPGQADQVHYHIRDGGLFAIEAGGSSYVDYDLRQYLAQRGVALYRPDGGENVHSAADKMIDQAWREHRTVIALGWEGTVLTATAQDRLDPGGVDRVLAPFNQRYGRAR
jgi:hypothetical protein